MPAEDAEAGMMVPARILSFEGLHGMVTLVSFSASQAAFKEPVRHCLRDEAKEVLPDERRKARGLPSCHVSRLTFHGSWKRAENDADGCGSFAAVERSMSDRLLG